MNVRMLEMLDQLAQLEREEAEADYVEILPPLHADHDRSLVAEDQPLSITARFGEILKVAA